MQSAIKYYLDFIKEYRSEENLKIHSVSQVDTEKCDVLETPQEQLSAKTKEVSEICNVDFKTPQSYTFTCPIAMFYFGEEHEIENWVQVYTQIAGFLYKDHPAVFAGIVQKDLYQDEHIKIADKHMTNRMVAPKEFISGLYIETNLCPTDIVSCIKLLLDMCHVGYENIRILYKSIYSVGDNEKYIAAPKTNDFLIAFLVKHEVSFVDNRAKGGCLWIKGKHELDNVVKYCRFNLGVVFQYKEEGTRAFDGMSGWWTKDYAKSVVDEINKSLEACPLTLHKRISASFEGQTFQKWLEKQGMALTTSRSYVSAINNCEQLANRLNLSSKKIYGVPLDEAKKTINLLMQTEEYQEANNRQHNRLRASMAKYLQYLSGDDNIKLEGQSHTHYEQKMTNDVIFEMNVDLTVYSQILFKEFSKGYRTESKLDLKRFISYYNAQCGTNLDARDDFVCQKIRQNILHAGIQYQNYVFSADSLISLETKDRLLDYIKHSFSQGKQVLYYRAIFEDFNDDFLEQRIYDEDMLRTYLMYECKDKYVFERNYMSQEKSVQVEPKREIKQALVSHGAPMKCKELYKSLSHFSKDVIEGVLHRNKEFIYNTQNEYFHVSLIDFSDDELENIAGLIQNIIENHQFVSGNEMVEVIRAKYPMMIERFSQFSYAGLRDAIAYYLGTRFSFNGNIISSLQKPMSMNDVFAEFAKTHSSFSLDELNVLKNELNSTIYFDAIYENSLRVSREQFVSKDEADFDVGRTDAVIASYCTEAYLPLSAISSFGAFPYAGFPWNIYLLEYYVSFYSAEFKLLHVGYNADTCVGAIVKKEASINDFSALITDVLVHSDIDLNRENALQYLYDMGYLARRRFSGIDQILIRAKAQKG